MLSMETMVCKRSGSVHKLGLQVMHVDLLIFEVHIESVEVNKLLLEALQFTGMKKCDTIEL